MVGVSAIMTKGSGDTQPSRSMRNNRINGGIVNSRFETGRGRRVEGTATVGRKMKQKGTQSVRNMGDERIIT